MNITRFAWAESLFHTYAGGVVMLISATSRVIGTFLLRLQKTELTQESRET